MPRIYVVDVPEFFPLVESARKRDDYRVTETGKGYFVIEATGSLQFSRKEMQLKPALWYGMFTGGLDGEITEWDRDTVTIVDISKKP